MDLDGLEKLLRHHIDGQAEQLVQMRASLDRIESHVMKTNGRVSKLEERMAIVWSVVGVVVAVVAVLGFFGKIK